MAGLRTPTKYGAKGGNKKMTPITKKFNGKVYHLAVTRVRKDTANKEAKKLRRIWGSLVRVVRESDGKYSVYSRHTS